MAHNIFGKLPGKITTQAEFFRWYPDDKTAMQWFIWARWGDTPCCPHCGSENVNMTARHPTMPHRCRAGGCRKYFSVKIGTAMEGSNLGYRDWLYSGFLQMTSCKSVSSWKLHRDLGVTQKTAWFVLQRLRTGLDGLTTELTGNIEVDETYLGGKRKNMSKKKRKALAKLGRGAVGKEIVIGAISRKTDEVVLRKIPDTGKKTLQAFVDDVAQEGVTVYTDEHKSYVGLDKKGNRKHKTVRHSKGEYVNGDASTNLIESFWATLKRMYHGTWHHISKKHLSRYLHEVAGRHNMRQMDTWRKMSCLFAGMVGRRLRYADLIG